MRVYACSKAVHAPWWAALAGAGVPITCSWIHWPYNSPGSAEPSNDSWRDHWQQIIIECQEADICLFVCNEGETACGQLIEAGAVLANGGQCFIVSPYTWTFANHPRCRTFDSIESAVRAILSIQEGKHLREAA
jgi:hypothetical protein